MISPDRANLKAALLGTSLKDIQSEMLTLYDQKYIKPQHGHFEDWRIILESLPALTPSICKLNQDTIQIGIENDISSTQKNELEEKLKELTPWRKGPFELFSIHIDTEWRSDWKWSRISPHINLKDKVVLDIGSGNGYYGLRMQAMGARLVIGVDPSWHYVFQFHVLQKYLPIEQLAFVLPFSLEEFPMTYEKFDTVFSMGVLYHRKDPAVHLKKIYNLLAKDGQLVLETLIIDGKAGEILVPEDRYANMRNVWMIPNIDVLQIWLKDAGFIEISVLDSTMTTTQEQRQTEWMTRYSLEQALNSENHALTIEGHPAPLRVTIIANK